MSSSNCNIPGQFVGGTFVPGTNVPVIGGATTIPGYRASNGQWIASEGVNVVNGIVGSSTFQSPSNFCPAGWISADIRPASSY